MANLTDLKNHITEGATELGKLAIQTPRFVAGVLKPYPNSNARGFIGNYSASLANLYSGTTSYEQWHNPKLLIDKFSPAAENEIRETLFQRQDIVQSIGEDMDTLYEEYRKNSVDNLFEQKNNPNDIYVTLSSAQQDDDPSFQIESPEEAELKTRITPKALASSNIRSVRDAIKLHGTMLREIEAHHAQKESALNEFIKQHPDQADRKDELLANINDSHHKALTAFNNAMLDKIKTLFQEAQTNFLLTAEFQRAYTNSAEMRAIIDEAIKNKVTPASGGVLTTITGKMKPDVSGITYDSFTDKTDERINHFKTLTGREVSRKMTEEGPQYTIQFPHRYWHSSYYHSVKDNVKADMLTLAKLTMAGPPPCDGITMSIPGPMSEHTLYMARKAYEACIESGFNKDKIDITIGGEKVTLVHPTQGIFKTELERNNVEEKAQAFKIARESGDVGKEIQLLSKFKDDLTAIRDKEKAKEKETIPEFVAGVEAKI